GMKRYLLLPLFFQLLLSLSILYCVDQLIYAIPFIDNSLKYLEANYSWLANIFSFLIFLPMLIFSGFLSNILAPIILSPFLELYAQKIFSYHNHKLPDGFVEVTFRSGIIREIKKSPYFLKLSGIILLCTIFTPFFFGITGLIGVCIAGWAISCEYMDLIGSMHGENFERIKLSLAQNKFNTISMGAPIAFFATIPILNIFTPFIATACACNFWINSEHS
ncbi:MAG: hypothetical protein HOI53_02615, partial [Francisellaceae bacterium]|nr:hypothetical protein [Francisellaceae bacterium]